MLSLLSAKDFSEPWDIAVNYLRNGIRIGFAFAPLVGKIVPLSWKIIALNYRLLKEIKKN